MATLVTYTCKSSRPHLIEVAIKRELIVLVLHINCEVGHVTAAVKYVL